MTFLNLILVLLYSAGLTILSGYKLPSTGLSASMQSIAQDALNLGAGAFRVLVIGMFALNGLGAERNMKLRQMLGILVISVGLAAYAFFGPSNHATRFGLYTGIAMLWLTSVPDRLQMAVLLGLVSKQTLATISNAKPPTQQ